MKLLVVILMLSLLVNCADDAGLVSDEDKRLHEMPQDPAQTNEKLLDEQDVQIVEQEVQYFNQVNGFLASPKEKTPRHGVVMIHEWWGLNDNIKNMARKLAKEGYTVLAVDLYNGNVATKAEDAMKFMQAVDQEEAVKNMKAAANYLKQQGANQLATLGWCFGGKQSLQLSLNMPIDATVIYYGHLEDDETKLQNLKGPVLGIFAEKDKSIPPSAVNKFESALNNINHQNDITIYPNVDHAFANPSGARYAPEETKDAWQKTVNFLKQELRS